MDDEVHGRVADWMQAHRMPDPEQAAAALLFFLRRWGFEVASKDDG